MPFSFARETFSVSLHPRDAVLTKRLFRSPGDVFILPGVDHLEDYIASFPSDQLEEDFRTARKVCNALANALAEKKLSYVGIEAAIAVTLRKFPFFRALSPKERSTMTEEYVDTLHAYVDLYLMPIQRPRCESSSSHIPEHGIFSME